MFEELEELFAEELIVEDLPAKAIRNLKCCIEGRCNECSYQKYFDDCGDRLNQDCLTLIQAVYKPEREE